MSPIPVDAKPGPIHYGFMGGGFPYPGHLRAGLLGALSRPARASPARRRPASAACPGSAPARAAWRFGRSAGTSLSRARLIGARRAGTAARYGFVRTTSLRRFASPNRSCPSWPPRPRAREGVGQCPLHARPVEVSLLAGDRVARRPQGCAVDAERPTRLGVLAAELKVAVGGRPYGDLVAGEPAG